MQGSGKIPAIPVPRDRRLRRRANYGETLCKWAAGRPLGNLSRKQIGVLKMVSEGMTNSQIAEYRGTTIRAVEGIISRIFDGLGINPTAEGNARVEASRRYLQATAQDQFSIQ